MPRRLDVPTERVNWRIETPDVELLNAVYKGRVNTVMREHIRKLCDRIRVQLEGSAD